MRRLAAAAVLAAVMMVWPGVAAGQVQYLGWWDTGGDGQNPQSNSQTIAETWGTVNLTMNVQVWDLVGYRWASAAQQKVSLTWPLTFYLAMDRDVPVTAEMQYWLTLAQSHRDKIGVIFLADEQDCNYRGARFPNGWTASNCEKARLQAEANIAVIRAYLPGVPIWVNYTSAFANWFTSDSASGRKLPSADWISFDCYTAWDRCYGSKSVERLVKGIEKHTAAWQRIVLIPQGMVYWGQDPAAVADIGQRYWNYAQTDPRVVAVMPFIYWSSGSWLGGRDAWQVRQRWASIGQVFLAR